MAEIIKNLDMIESRLAKLDKEKEELSQYYTLDKERRSLHHALLSQKIKGAHKRMSRSKVSTNGFEPRLQRPRAFLAGCALAARSLHHAPLSQKIEGAHKRFFPHPPLCRERQRPRAILAGCLKRSAARCTAPSSPRR